MLRFRVVSNQNFCCYWCKLYYDNLFLNKNFLKLNRGFILQQKMVTFFEKLKLETGIMNEEYKKQMRYYLC